MDGGPSPPLADSVRLGARGWAMTMTCVVGEGPVSVHVLPIDVAGSLSKASPGQACGQWLTPRLPRNTRDGVNGDGAGVVLGNLCGVRAPQEVKGNALTPGRGANANKMGELAPEICLNCNLPRQFGAIHQNK